MANFFANYPKDFDNVGKLFANAYYGQLQADRKSVGNMYHDMAIMTYEGRMIEGKQAIIKHFEGLSWGSLAVSISCCDCQPIEHGYLVFVSGQFKVDNDEKALPFSESFVLKKTDANIFIFHSMFRLNLHNF